MDPNNQTVANPGDGDAPSVVPPESQDQPGDSQQDGNAPAAPANGGEPQQQGAPEPPKYVYQLTGDLQSNEHVLKHQNINELVQAYVDYAAKADRLIEVPGDDADDATRDAFLDRFRPATPEEYQLSAPPDGVPYSSEAEAAFRTLAHQLGLTQQQAKQLHQYDVERTQAAIAQQQTAQKQKLEALRKDWGDAFDANVKEAQAAFKEIATQLEDDSLAERMVKTGYGNDPDMLRTFYGIWQMIKPDGMVSGTVDGNSAGPETYYPNTQFDS